MLTEQISVNTKILEQFTRIFQSGRLAHAYLFIGPALVGKSETALAIAKMINCEAHYSGNKNFCDGCPSCKKINGGNHPDIHILERAEGEKIKIEQIRSVLDQVKLRSFMANKKVFIIKDIEHFTLESANALLKTLEEPSADSLLILTTSVSEKNLDTIRSRCHAVYFSADLEDGLASQLEKNFQLNTNDAHFLAYFSQGCLGKAIELKNQNILSFKEDVINQFILSEQSETFLKSVLDDKDKTKVFLSILLSWVRDAILLKAGVNDQRLIHLSRKLDLHQFQKSFSFEDLNKLNDQIVSTYKLYTDNLNIKMSVLIIKELLWVN